MTSEGPEKPLSIIKGMKGVVHVFYLDRTILEQMRDEEKKVLAAGDISVDNFGFTTALTRQHVIAIIKDPRFRPPPEPTVELLSADNQIMGVEVFPNTAPKYMDRKDVIWLSDAFVMFPNVNGNGSERFVMPCVSFPELNESNGCKDVMSCSPAPSCDLMMRKYYQYPDDPKLASVLVGFNDA